MEGAALAVCHAGPTLALGGGGALARVRDDPPWHSGEARAQLPEARRRSSRVPTARPQDIEPGVVLIDGAPEVRALAMHGHNHLVQMPLVTRPGPPARMGRVLTKLATPWAEGVMGDVDPTGTAFQYHGRCGRTCQERTW